MDIIIILFRLVLFYFRCNIVLQPSQLPPTERIATSDIAAQAAYKRMNLGAPQESVTQRNIRMRVSFLIDAT